MNKRRWVKANEWKDKGPKWPKILRRLTNRQFRYQTTKTPTRILHDPDRETNNIQKGLRDWWM